MTVMFFLRAMRVRMVSRSSLWRTSRNRLLGDGAREQHALALAVADGVKVALGKLERVDGLHRFVHDALVFAAEHAEPSGVRVPAGGHNVAAGRELDLDALGEDHGELFGELAVGDRLHIPSLEKDLPPDRFQVTRDGLEQRGFARAVRADERDDLALLYFDGDIADDRHLMVADREIVDHKIGRIRHFRPPFRRSIM